MKIHPREPLVNEVEAKILATIHRETARLTEAESLRVVNKACSGWIASVAKYAIRLERHGDADQPGGLAPDDERRSSTATTRKDEG